MATNGEFLQYSAVRIWGKRLAPLAVLSSTGGELIPAFINETDFSPPHIRQAEFTL